VYVGYFDYTDKMIGETVRVQTDPIVEAQVFQSAQDRRQGYLENRGTRSASKHFYLLRGVLFCGHCGSAMGGRTHKAGHQHVYYCVNKERGWVTRDENHPKWKRGIGCSMDRSVNIAMTDKVVWNMLKNVLQEVRDKSPELPEATGHEHQSLHDSERLLAEGVTWLSAKQIDLLSEEERRTVVLSAITRASVFFDKGTNKHRVEVQFSDQFTRLINVHEQDAHDTASGEDPTSEPSEAVTEDEEAGVGKKLQGSEQAFAAEFNHSVTVE
jgi:hypothetical protein